MVTTKKPIPEMYPIKQWLSQKEACSFVDMSKPFFLEFASAHRLSISTVGAKKYYKVTEIQNALKNNIIIRQTA